MNGSGYLVIYTQKYTRGAIGSSACIYWLAIGTYYLTINTCACVSTKSLLFIVAGGILSTAVYCSTMKRLLIRLTLVSSTFFTVYIRIILVCVALYAHN